MTKSVSVKRSIRIQKWIDQVRDYNQRPEGEFMTAWCKRNGIPTSTFATSLHRVQDLHFLPAYLPAHILQIICGKQVSFRVKLEIFDVGECGN